MSAVLETSGLRAGYGSATDVLLDVDLAIESGSAVGVLGANGAGKSTLLKTLAGLLPARSGTIAVDGNVVPNESPSARLRRGVVLLPEGHRTIRTLSVEENLRLASISHWPRRSRALTQEMLPVVYGMFPVLGERRHQMAGLLSGGEQQMVSLGRALVSQPRVLLLDEPSLGLAPVVIERIYQSLETLRQTGLSLLVVEQNHARLDALCEHIHVLRLGEVTTSFAGGDVTDEALRDAYFGTSGNPSRPSLKQETE